MPPKGRGMNRRQFIKLAGSGSVTVALAGCSSDGGTETPEDTQTTDSGGDDNGGTDSTDTDGDGMAIEDNSMTALAGKSLRSLDPHKVSDDLTQVVGLTMYDPMMKVDADGRPIQHLITDMQAENDGKTWVFTLRDDVTFHSGNKLTADDVAYSANRWRALNTGYAGFWSGYVEQGEIEARNENTVAFNLAQPFGPFIASLVMFKVIDSALVKENEQSGDHGDRGDYGQQFLAESDAGSGPYQLDEYAGGDNVTFSYFEDYFQGWESGQFGDATIEFVQEESTTRQLMKQGEAEMTDQYLSPEAYADMESADNVTVVQEPQPQIYEIMMNCQKEPLDDVNVRKAIALAYDYETALNEIWATAEPCPGPVPSVMEGHNDDLQPYTQDVQAAKQAISDSSYTLEEINSSTLELSWISSVDLERRLSLLLKNNLSDIGITNVEVKGMPWTSWTGLIGDPSETPHFSNFFHSGDLPTPDNFTFKKYHPDASGTIVSASWFNSQEVFDDAGVSNLPTVMEEARTTMDTDQRLEKYKTAQEMIVQGYPSIFLSNPQYKLALSSNVVDSWQYSGGILGYPRQIYPLSLE